MKQIIKMYDNIWESFGNKMVDEATELLTVRFKRNNINLNVLKGKTVLDMGCGSGRYSIALKKLGAKKVIGVDIGNGKKFKYKGIEYKKGNVLNLPFKDNTFDFVFCNGVLHHTKDTEKGIKELFRVLKKGCFAWLFVCGKCKLLDMADIIRKKLNFKDEVIFRKVLELYKFPVQKQFLLTDLFFVEHRDYFTIPQLSKWFKEIGFSKWRYLKRGSDLNFVEMIYHKEKDYKYYKNLELRFLLQK